MADRTRCVPYVAGWLDRPHVHGATEQETIDEIVIDLLDLLDRGMFDPEAIESEAINVYVDCTLCLGPDGDEDCACGFCDAHEDRTWTLLAWERRSVRLLTVVRPADEDGDFDIQIDDEVTHD